MLSISALSGSRYCPRSVKVQRLYCHAAAGTATAGPDLQPAAQSKVKLSFALPYRCNFGQNICMVGSANLLGQWDTQKGVQMDWGEGDVWTADLELQASQDAAELEYKYIVRDPDGTISAWRPGSNCYLQLASLLQKRQDLLERIRIQDAWDGFSEIQIDWTTQHLEQSQQLTEQDSASGSQPSLESEAAAAEETMQQQAQQQSHLSPEDFLIRALSSRADGMLAELDQAINESLKLLQKLKDPTHPEALRADQRIAAAAEAAMEASRALQAAEASQSGRLRQTAFNTS